MLCGRTDAKTLEVGEHDKAMLSTVRPRLTALLALLTALPTELHRGMCEPLAASRGSSARKATASSLALRLGSKLRVVPGAKLLCSGGSPQCTSAQVAAGLSWELR